MTNKNRMRNWLDELKLSHPLVIAGPCSAETEEQLMQVAHELQGSDVSYFRAGLWKPRTQPGHFEGVGATGLKWLQRVKAETGMKVATEVANAKHVELALAHDIDLVWIGSRSAVSPFIVQEIAEALAGTDKIVLLKNPINPDLGLWSGGVERLCNAKIKKLGVIHRGFSTYDKTKYRNTPEWQLVIDFQNKFPELPIICDPSHIAGTRDLILEISQTALDLNLDGLMIETHGDPHKAWSDAAQQVTPHILFQLCKKLQVKKETSNEQAYNSSLNKLRSQIDVIDNSLLDLLVRRMSLSEQIGILKKTSNTTVLQNTRWSEMLQHMIEEGKSKGLSEAFIAKLFKAIHQESIDRQEHIINP